MQKQYQHACSGPLQHTAVSRGLWWLCFGLRRLMMFLIRRDLLLLRKMPRSSCSMLGTRTEQHLLAAVLPACSL